MKALIKRFADRLLASGIEDEQVRVQVMQFQNAVRFKLIAIAVEPAGQA